MIIIIVIFGLYLLANVSLIAAKAYRNYEEKKLKETIKERILQWLRE